MIIIIHNVLPWRYAYIREREKEKKKEREKERIRKGKEGSKYGKTILQDSGKEREDGDDGERFILWAYGLILCSRLSHQQMVSKQQLSFIYHATGYKYTTVTN